jgi:hypothetical protein
VPPPSIHQFLKLAETGCFRGSGCPVAGARDHLERLRRGRNLGDRGLARRLPGPLPRGKKRLAARNHVGETPTGSERVRSIGDRVADHNPPWIRTAPGTVANLVPRSGLEAAPRQGLEAGAESSAAEPFPSRPVFDGRSFGHSGPSGLGELGSTRKMAPASGALPASGFPVSLTSESTPPKPRRRTMSAEACPPWNEKSRSSP